MSYRNISSYNDYSNKYEELDHGQSVVIHNPIDYQPTFQHSKWKQTMKKKFSIILLVAKLPKATAMLFAEIDMNLIRGSNVADIGSPKSSSVRSRAAKELIDLKIAKRAGVNKFMLSPEIRVPSGNRIHAEVEKWNMLEPKTSIIPPDRRIKPPTKGE